MLKLSVGVLRPILFFLCALGKVTSLLWASVPSSKRGMLPSPKEIYLGFFFLFFFFFFFWWRAIWDAKNDQVLLLAPFWFLVKLNIFSNVYCPFIFLPSIALFTSCFHFPTGMFFLMIWENLSVQRLLNCVLCVLHILSPGLPFVSYHCYLHIFRLSH